MDAPPVSAAAPESRFAALVEDLSRVPSSSDRLVDLLREDHPSYAGRSGAAVVRMRGWVLDRLGRVGVPDPAIPFVYEELDTGTEPYLVAAAARAARAIERPPDDLAPRLVRAIAAVRGRDEPVSFEAYGEYATSDRATGPIRELLLSLEALGARARTGRDALRELVYGANPLPTAHRAAAARILSELDAPPTDAESTDCCRLPSFWRHAEAADGTATLDDARFEDQAGSVASFRDLRGGRPAVVVFFYTRCDNPSKCSLTVSKLSRVRRLLDESAEGRDVRALAVTYDPAYDTPERLRRYGEVRGVPFGPGFRFMRATHGFDAVRRFFRLGVGFVGTIVNRHRIEVFLLDADGRIAASHSQVAFDELDVADRALALVRGGGAGTSALAPPRRERRGFGGALLGTIGSIGVAFFPKCPVCWAAYLSMFGVAGVDRIPYSPWLEPILGLLILINLASIWLRGRARRRWGPLVLAAAGAAAIAASRAGLGPPAVATAGVVLTLVGSLASVFVSRGRFGRRKPPPAPPR